MDDENLGDGKKLFLKRKVKNFWIKLIEKYLPPLGDDKTSKKLKQLKDLRDKAVFAFFMINAIFVLTIFLLTLKKDMIHINWPLDVKVNISYSEENEIIYLTKEYLQLEPIGLVFVFFFGIILVIQFTAMLVHRVDTLAQVMATTHVRSVPEDLYHGPINLDTAKKINNPIDRIKFLQRLKGNCGCIKNKKISCYT